MGSTGPSEEKVWEKPWTTVDLINNATSWSLAGDAGVNSNHQAFISGFILSILKIEATTELEKVL